jgi:hypothetical protein
MARRLSSGRCRTYIERIEQAAIDAPRPSETPDASAHATESFRREFVGARCGDAQMAQTAVRIRSAELDVGAQATVGEKPFERINFRGFDQIDVKACSVGSAAVLWPSIARQRHEE